MGIIESLLNGPAWVEYRTRIDLLSQEEGSSDVKSARIRMLADPLVTQLIVELAGWPGVVLNSHRSAGQHYHKLNFLADLGITAEDTGMRPVVERILVHQSDEGPFQLPTHVPEHFGGSGVETGAWALCDAPLILYALSKLGLGGDPRVRRGIDYLLTLGRDNGWPCTVSKELGKFRGPGRKDDPCPYATLAMLKLLSINPQDRNHPMVKNGVESLLDLWQQRQEKHPYMFFMGTDFSKLKAPLVWYDLLHALDVLSNYTDYRNDPRLLSMVDLLKSKASADGWYTPESIWTAWKDWEFGQKKSPSYWVTFLSLRIIQRIENWHS
jgi:hypothetical protein